MHVERRGFSFGGDPNSGNGRNAVSLQTISTQNAAWLSGQDVWRRAAVGCRRPGLLVPSDLGDELRHVVGVDALHDVGGHRPLAEARLLASRRRVLQASVGDRVQHELLGRLDHIEVRSDLADRVGPGQRMAQPAMLAEQLTPALLGGGQLDPADLAVGVVAIAEQEHHGEHYPEPDVDDHEHQPHRPPAPVPRLLTGATGAADA